MRPEMPILCVLRAQFEAEKEIQGSVVKDRGEVAGDRDGMATSGRARMTV